MQRTLSSPGSAGLHLAIIMDGNGRWATSRGLPRTAGHRAGAKAVRRTVETCLARPVSTLTLYAFSSDNWKRPPGEVRTLMRLLESYLREQTAKCVERGIRISVIGRRDRLPPTARAAVEAAEEATRACSGLHLRLAVDYSARDAIVFAAARFSAAVPDAGGSQPEHQEAFGRLLNHEDRGERPAPDVDLLIRTGGEQRLSDFLLWECAYAELVFVPVMWPDFGEADLDAALSEFQHRERRFGGLGVRSANVAGGAAGA